MCQDEMFVLHPPRPSYKSFFADRLDSGSSKSKPKPAIQVIRNRGPDTEAKYQHCLICQSKQQAAAVDTGCSDISNKHAAI